MWSRPWRPWTPAPSFNKKLERCVFYRGFQDKYNGSVVIFRIFGFLGIFSVFLSGTQAREEFTLFETLRYNPAQVGLKGLEFEVRVSGQGEMISRAQAFGDIKDLYYRVKWSPTGGHRVRVVGPPEGFGSLREQLKSSILPRLDFVIPRPLTTSLTPYNFERVRREGGVTLEGRDRTGGREINAVSVDVNGQGLIEEIRTSSPRGVESSKMKYGRYRGTNNKYVVTQTIVETLLAGQKRVVETNIDYKMQNGYALPEDIQIKTEVSLNVGPEESRKSEQQESSLRFSNYKIN